MQNFLTGDDRRAQRLLRSSALNSGVGPLCGAQEMSEQGASAAREGKLRTEYAERYTFSSALGSVNCVMRPLARVGRSLMRLAPLVVWGALLLAPIRLEAATLTTTQTLQATIVPLGGLFTLTSPLALFRTGATFNRFSGTMTLSYHARTSQGTGHGTITVKATADFTPAGGPSISKPPSAGDKFTYTCSGATLGTPCSGTQTVSTTAATTVVSIGASACTGGGPPCSSANPNWANVTFTLTNDPKYKTGSYSASLTWTISAS